MIYVDFDGVIMDTYLPVFSLYLERTNNGDVIDPVKYVMEKDWRKALLESKEINDSLKYLKSREDAIILTKIYSMENEGASKIKFLRDNGIKNNIILSPYMFKKSDIVIAAGNILIDDTISNLDDFSNNNGLGIYFNKDNLDIDGFGIKNTKYTKVRSLDILKRL